MAQPEGNNWKFNLGFDSPYTYFNPIPKCRIRCVDNLLDVVYRLLTRYRAINRIPAHRRPGLFSGGGSPRRC